MANRDQIRNDTEESLRLALDGRQAVMWTAMPGIVTAVDLADNTVSVQLAIQSTVEDENGGTESVNLPVLQKVPICFPSAGGFVLTMPIAAGDEVLVIFGSRCIDSWWQNGGVGRPMEARMHDLSDGFAIPGPRSVPKAVTGISTTGAQLRNNAGDTFLEISADGKIKMTASDIEIEGNVAITGDVEVTGTITSTGEITSGLIPLTTHRHTNVVNGPNTSGTPVP